ncbi:DNA-binding protein [Candidatus Kaiserbacteria bacterium]|nr:DNA-binding protein [Candidatus Kaiserbacteria bacterium]
MDELVIGEKKYISSKQAAKATGYAKDYVGQLCREGRVPARLVGRSWYVLESAIQDHRFGEPKNQTEVSRDEKQENKTPVSEWETPRYEASNPELLPSINRLQTEVKSLVANQGEETHRLQDTWQAWFDKFEGLAHASPVIHRKIEKEPDQEIEQEVIEETVDLPVPVRAIHHPHYQTLSLQEEPIVLRQTEAIEELEQEWSGGHKNSSRRGVQKIFVALQLVGVLGALLIMISAICSTGYLDTYIVSNSTARLFAGVSIYNK